MSRALVGLSGVSLTSLALHFARFLDSHPAPPASLFDPCPVCPLPLAFDDWHTPSLVAGICIGAVVLPLLELLALLRSALLSRLARGLRAPFLFRLL